MKRAYRIALRPSRKQRAAFARHAGAARWAWNWGLARKQEAYQATGKSPSAIELHRALNELKKRPVEEGGVPWMYEVSLVRAARGVARPRRCVQALLRQDAARYPRFKSRERSEPHFRLTGTIRVELEHVQPPRIGKVRIAPGERLYVPGALYGSVSLVQEHGRWFASLTEPLAQMPAGTVSDGPPQVGIDLGVRKLATLSDGTPPYPNPKALAKAAAFAAPGAEGAVALEEGEPSAPQEEAAACPASRAGPQPAQRRDPQGNDRHRTALCGRGDGRAAGQEQDWLCQRQPRAARQEREAEGRPQPRPARRLARRAPPPARIQDALPGWTGRIRLARLHLSTLLLPRIRQRPWEQRDLLLRRVWTADRPRSERCAKHPFRRPELPGGRKRS
jgi:hypothetical protein